MIFRCDHGGQYRDTTGTCLVCKDLIAALKRMAAGASSMTEAVCGPDYYVQLCNQLRATLAARDAEIERLKALVEKRERQLVWAVQHRPEIVVDDRGSVLWGAIHSDHGIEFDGSDAGLLAAIDEATSERGCE